jgi:hypothetical protein
MFAIRLCPDPLLRGRTYICTYSGASQGNSYIQGVYVNMCTGDSCYTEVGFNTTMYSVLEQEASEKTNALSLRDRREPSQYYQYQAIPRYITFYNVYVKSAKGTLCS